MIRILLIGFLLCTTTFVFLGCRNYSYREVTAKYGIQDGLSKKEVFTQINNDDRESGKASLGHKQTRLVPFPFGYMSRRALHSMPSQVQEGYAYVVDDCGLTYYSAKFNENFDYVNDDVFDKTYLWELHIGKWPVDHLAIYFNEKGRVYRLEEFLIYFEMP